MNRVRLDAEQVRDAILQISDRLDLRMGGPSDMQFDLQPGDAGTLEWRPVFTRSSGKRYEIAVPERE